MSQLCDCHFTVLFIKSGVEITCASDVITSLRNGGVYLLPVQRLLSLSSHSVLAVRNQLENDGRTSMRRPTAVSWRVMQHKTQVISILSPKWTRQMLYTCHL